MRPTTSAATRWHLDGECAEFRAAAPGDVDSLIGMIVPGSFDALEFARAQLHSAVRDLEGSDIAPGA
jgi:hypothetical protein